MYKVIVIRSAEKELEKLPTRTVRKIFGALEDLSQNPRPVGSKKLVGQKENLWRIRIGDYRIVYTFNSKENKVCVVKIEHRQGVYK